MKKSYLSGITLATLSKSAKGLQDTIATHQAVAESLLKERKKMNASLKGLGRIGKNEILTFEEVVKTYNEGISDDEIKAWVYYKRKSGVPMNGWNKWFLNAKDIHDETKKIQELVKKGVLFIYGTEFQPLPIYTYGNIYDRLFDLDRQRELIIRNYGQSTYDRHKEVLEAAKPPLLSLSNADPKERPIITAISDFATDPDLFTISTVSEEYLNIEDAEQLKYVNGNLQRKKDSEKIKLTLDADSDYTLQDVFISYLYSLNLNTDFEESNATSIVDYYLLGKSLRNDQISADEKAQIKAQARIEGERLFAKFLHEVVAFDDQQKLDFAWNRVYNGQSDINYLKVPVGFTCSKHFKSGLLKITPIQRQGVAFMEAMGSGINAFDVGVGKTMTAIINLAHQIQCGKTKRPVIVVPKPTYKKWIREIIGYTDRETGEFVPGVLSGTGITINEWSNLGTGVIGKIELNKPVPEKSITLLTYEGFKKIGFGRAVSADLVVELVNVLEQSENEDDDRSTRDKEIDYQKYREMIGLGEKGTVADIDKLGFDYFVIDEAHRCKNVFAYVKADEDGKKRYSMSSATSETGIKAFLLLSYIQRKFGRNVMLLTATPFTNSPLEIYSMLSLVAYDSMVRNGLRNLDTFFDMFVMPTVEWAANYKEEIVEKEVIKSFNNRLILQKIIYNHILYKTGEEAGVKRPIKVNLPITYEIGGTGKRLPLKDQVLTYIKQTPKQREIQTRITDLSKYATKPGAKLDKALLFKMLAKNLDNAFSPFMASGETPENYKEFVEESPKILYTMECIRSVKKWHEDKKEPVSGQVIYSNRGKDYFHYIKEYLEKEIGYKRTVKFEGMNVDEVEIISSDINENRKENVKEAFLAGIVKIIIGTATIREGIDLQRKGTVLYDLYPEWNPTDIRQLEGRIWRQGNEFEYVRVVMPLMQDSMDVFVFQKLEEKTARINDIWYKADRGNVLDLESIDPNEIKLALITDVDRLVKIVYDERLKELERQYARKNEELKILNTAKRDIDMYWEYKKKILAFLDTYIVTWKENVEKSNKEESHYKAKKELLKKFEDFSIKSTQTDKEILSVMRAFESFFNESRTYNPHQYITYTTSYYREYVSKVRKTEKTMLTPRGLNIGSNLQELEFSLKMEIEGIKTTYESFKGKNGTKDPENSAIWQDIRKEINQKKSTYNVEGKDAIQRAEDFKKLNYLLDKKVVNAPAPAPALDLTMLKLKANAIKIKIEIELELKKRQN